MYFSRDIDTFPENPSGCVATIGHFDGVHLGHEALLKQLKNRAKDLHLPAVLITFEPYAWEYFAKFAKEAPSPRLTRIREKLLYFKKHGIEQVLCLRFNQKLATLSPEAFVQTILRDALNVRCVLVGEDFRFGSGQAGDLTQLRKLLSSYGALLEAFPTVSISGERVSSTGIRKALLRGEVYKAALGLGRSYRFSGHVGYGEKRGSILGVPTANVFLHKGSIPLSGVYVVSVAGLSKEVLRGVANIGMRPTFGGTKPLLEVHILDFNEEIYGKRIEVQFLHKLRDEKKFPSLDALKHQIFKDLEVTKAYFTEKC